MTMNNMLEERRKAWDIIFSDPNLSVNSLRQRAIAGTVCQQGLRSVCWKVFLGHFPTMEVSKWPSIQIEERQRYTDLKHKYIDEPAEKMNMKEVDNLSDNNPLALNDNNPWQQYFADSEIRKVIRQDVERTFPDVDFFRSNEVQQRLTDILFIYCKINRQVSYRQGMHELLAPFYWIIASDSLDSTEYSQDLIDPSTKLMAQVLDAAYVEHDAYILFNRLMIYGKSWYEYNDDVPVRRPIKPDILSDGVPKPTDSARLNPVVMTCHRIHHQYLRSIDPILYTHLENYGIEPQLYGLRWIRLLFGREFEIHDLFKLWDAIFAQDSTLKIVEYICLVMLLRMRDDLLRKDYAECLSLLMRPSKITKPTTLVEQAKYLQDNLSEDTALHILQQNDAREGKHPRNSLTDGVDINVVNNRLSTREQRVLHHRRSYGAQLDSSFSQITTGMMKNSQVRHLNKAIAGVMDTVQKNVNHFGENVLGRTNQDDFDNFPRRSGEFPAGIDRMVTALKQERPSATNIISEENTSFMKLKKMNNNMGEVVAKCINILEEEIFSADKNKENISTEEAVRHGESDSETQTMGDDIDSSKGEQESKAVTDAPSDKDEAKIIMALVGLKHVRDVLMGKQTYFDDSLMDNTMQNNNISNDEIKKDVESSNEQQKPLPPHTPISHKENTLSQTDYDKNKPLPVITQTSFDPPVSIFYTPANPAPLKQQVKYRIEDLLSDPTFKLPSAKASNNDKFKWMLSSEESNSDVTHNSTAISSNNPNNASHDLFKTNQGTRPSPRKRRSFIMSRTVPAADTIESTIDPLDAKNVDSRKSYEYDLL